MKPFIRKRKAIVKSNLPRIDEHETTVAASCGVFQVGERLFDLERIEDRSDGTYTAVVVSPNPTQNGRHARPRHYINFKFPPNAFERFMAWFLKPRADKYETPF